MKEYIAALKIILYSFVLISCLSIDYVRGSISAVYSNTSSLETCAQWVNHSL